MIEADIITLITRLGRPHPSGGTVIERAAIVAQGRRAPEVIDWILNHHGAPESLITTRARRRSGSGLHGSRIANGNSPSTVPPARFVLPAGVLD